MVLYIYPCIEKCSMKFIFSIRDPLHLWGHALKRSTGIIRKSKVLYPDPGFLSSATWPSLPKKHYNGLYNQPCVYLFNNLFF